MSSVYEEYMRNVLGYEPIRYRDTYDAEYNDYMNYSNFNIPQQFETNIETSRLESCYPDIYNLVYPMVKKACSKNNRALSSDLVDELTNEIYNAIEDDSLNENRTSEIKNRSIDVKTSSKSIENKTNLIRQESSSKEDRQIRNQGLQDLIKILLIRELINNSGFRPRPPAPPRHQFRHHLHQDREDHLVLQWDQDLVDHHLIEVCMNKIMIYMNINLSRKLAWLLAFLVLLQKKCYNIDILM